MTNNIQQQASADVLVDGIGESVLRFTFAPAPNSDVLTWVEDNVETSSWQWLGSHVLGVDHHYAQLLIDALTDAGFTVQA